MNWCCTGASVWGHITASFTQLCSKVRPASISLGGLLTRGRHTTNSHDRPIYHTALRVRLCLLTQVQSADFVRSPRAHRAAAMVRVGLMHVAVLVALAAAAPVSPDAPGALAEGVTFAEEVTHQALTNSTHLELLLSQQHANGTVSEQGLRDMIHGLRNQVNEARNNLHNVRDTLGNVRNSLENTVRESASRLTQITDLTDQITGIRDVFTELGACTSEIPGFQSPMEVMTGLGGAWRNGRFEGVNRYIMQSAEPLLDAASDLDLTGPINTMRTSANQAANLTRHMVSGGRLNVDLIQPLAELALNAVQATMDIIPGYSCLRNAIIANSNDPNSLPGRRIVNLIVRLGTRVCVAPQLLAPMACVWDRADGVVGSCRMHARVFTRVRARPRASTAAPSRCSTP